MKKLAKKIAFLLIFTFCIESFAAIVSDNDGSAFVTKSEFEAMKRDFADQVINYNDSIDRKIDGAIASYLAGIKLSHTSILENKYLQINPTWAKNKRFDKSHKGTRYTKFISFIEGVFASSDNWVAYIFEGTTTGWYVVESITENSSDQEYLYRISKKKIGPFDKQWALQDLVKSDYSITVGGGAAGGRGGAINTDYRLIFPTATTFKKEKSDGTTQKLFGTWYDNLPLEVWSVDDSSKTKIEQQGNVSGSTGNGETCAITAIAKDVLEDDDLCFDLAGGELVNETMYCVNTASVSELGDMFATAETNKGGSRHIKLDTSGTSAYQQQYLSWTRGEGGSTNYPLGIKAEVYRHILDEINSTDILHEKITQLTGQKSYYYSGCPMFSTVTNGKVKFKIKFLNSDAANTKWALKNSAFGNEANPGNASGIEDCSEKTFNAGNDETIEVTFQAKKDTTYWIKAEPVSGRSMIEFVGDIVIVEE